MDRVIIYFELPNIVQRRHHKRIGVCSVGPPMAMEYSCAQILSHDFMQGLARELEFDQGAHRHTADLDNGNVDISVDISTKCREPSAYAVSGGYGETLWSRGLGRGKRKKRRGRKVEVFLYPQEHACLPKHDNSRTFPNLKSCPTYLGRDLGRATQTVSCILSA
jgi:hypothetical protein